MPIPTITGAILINLTIAQLGGYGNAFDPESLLAFVNEGKDEIWAIMKAVREDYFLHKSQNTTSTDDDYFADLTIANREFVLPNDFHQLKAIEVLNTGKNEVEFAYRDWANPEFQEARRTSTSNAIGGQRTTYFFTIGGKDQFIMAQFPEIAFNLQIWYIRSLPDLDMDGQTKLDEIMHPFSNKIALFAAKRAMLPLQDVRMWQAWRDEWKQAIHRIEVSASQRDISTRKVAQDWLGDG